MYLKITLPSLALGEHVQHWVALVVGFWVMAVTNKVIAW